MTVHLVNLTNPMMMKGPFRELIPVDVEVSVTVPTDLKVTSIKLLLRGEKVNYRLDQDIISISVPGIEDHEIIGFDLV
jgi:hypothetical protein